MPEYIDVTPTTHMLSSLRNKKLGWRKALAEIVDNSFDANANQVTIICQGKTIEVTDDGRGVADLAATVTHGHHRPTETTSLGMYGVGLKDAWHWIGRRMEITTVHNGNKGRLVADSTEIEKCGRWQVQSPEYHPTNEPTGTKIKLFVSKSSPNRSLPRDSDIAGLAWTFTPAMLEGKQIIYKRKRAIALKPIPLPTLIECVEDTFDVCGKEVYIRIGIIAEGQKMNDGPFWIQYGHRNIIGNAIGCANYSTDRIGGIIRLTKGWSLTSNKDDLTDLRDELNDAIYERIHHLLEKSEQLTQDVANDMLQTELESMLNLALSKFKKSKERRPGPRGKNKGTIKPSDKGNKRRKAANVDDSEPGEVEGIGKSDNGESQRKRRGVHLLFGTFDNDETLGAYDNLSNRITLNKSHPFILNVRDEKNVPAIHAIAFSIFCNWAVNNSDNQPFLFECGDFSIALGQVLSSVAQTREQEHEKSEV